MENQKEKYMKCPVCNEMSFRYDPEIKANRCYNKFCRWTDKIKPATDVPMSFLEFCLRNIQSGPRKDKLKKIIEETKKMYKEHDLCAC